MTLWRRITGSVANDTDDLTPPKVRAEVVRDIRKQELVLRALDEQAANILAGSRQRKRR